MTEQLFSETLKISLNLALSAVYFQQHNNSCYIPEPDSHRQNSSSILAYEDGISSGTIALRLTPHYDTCGRIDVHTSIA